MVVGGSRPREDQQAVCPVAHREPLLTGIYFSRLQSNLSLAGAEA